MGFSWILIFAIFCHFSVRSSPLQEKLAQANQIYHQGELATTFEDQKHAFNQSLFLYDSIGHEIGLPYPADLNQALGDAYFQLREYAWAILYYQRALKENPSDISIVSRLEKSQEHLGLPISSPMPFSQKWLTLVFSSQQINFLFLLILITFLICSSTIWLNNTLLRLLAIHASFFLLIFLILKGIIYYSVPLEGIMVASTGFYREPSLQYPQLTEQPLLAGSKVYLLQSTSDGNWLKVTTKEGLIGYIPFYTMRLI